jgi:hypothetical protein
MPRISSTVWSAGRPKGFAWQCLIARRLAERGVRFIELIDTGASNNWDSHGDMGQHGPLARTWISRLRRLLMDLKQRGMLEETTGRLGHGVWSDAI